MSERPNLSQIMPLSVRLVPNDTASQQRHMGQV